MNIVLEGIFLLLVSTSLIFISAKKDIDVNDANSLEDFGVILRKNKTVEIFPWNESLTQIDETYVVHKVRCREVPQLSDADELSSTSLNEYYTLECLPSFVIAGTQKSGTTILAALLNDHQLIKFPSKKEIHFFDKSSRYKQGLNEYFKYFNSTRFIINREDHSVVSLIGSSEDDHKNRNDNDSDIDSPVPFLFHSEATPYYIASRSGCKRIKEIIPEMKLIVLLREPIDRAYSEWQMKKRRVAEQDHFFKQFSIGNHTSTIFHCMIYAFSLSSSAIQQDEIISEITKCSPRLLTSNPRWKKFMKVVSGLISHKNKNQKKISALMQNVNDLDFVLENCFRLKQNLVPFNHSNCFFTGGHFGNISLYKSNVSSNAASCSIADHLGDVEVSLSQTNVDFGHFQYNTWLNRNDDENLRKIIQSLVYSAVNSNFFDTFPLEMNFEKCYLQSSEKALFETVKPLSGALIKEVDEFVKCSDIDIIENGE